METLTTQSVSVGGSFCNRVCVAANISVFSGYLSSMSVTVAQINCSKWAVILLFFYHQIFHLSDRLVAVIQDKHDKKDSDLLYFLKSPSLFKWEIHLLCISFSWVYLINWHHWQTIDIYPCVYVYERSSQTETFVPPQEPYFPEQRHQTATSHMFTTQQRWSEAPVGIGSIFRQVCLFYLMSCLSCSHRTVLHRCARRVLV